MASQEQVLLAGLTHKLVTKAVRRALEEPGATVVNWQVEKLGAGAGNPVSLGLFRLSGQAQIANQQIPWSLVLKAIQSPANLGFTDIGEGHDKTHWNYWQREYWVFNSGFLETLPPGMVAPKGYHLEPRPGDVIWLWMEDAGSQPEGSWTETQYHQAAASLGRLGGLFLTHQHLPDYDWWSRNFYDQWLVLMTDVLSNFFNFDSRPNYWDHPLVLQRYPPSDANPFRQLLLEKDRFLDALRRLPQTICHNDTYPTNFITRVGQGGVPEMLLLDWALVGIGPLGSDLGQLALGAFLDSDKNMESWIPDALLNPYLDGVAESGHQVNKEAVNFAYVTCAAFRAGLFQLYLFNEALQIDQTGGVPGLDECIACFEVRMAEKAFELIKFVE